MYVRLIIKFFSTDTPAKTTRLESHSITSIQVDNNYEASFCTAVSSVGIVLPEIYLHTILLIYALSCEVYEFIIESRFDVFVLFDCGS